MFMELENVPARIVAIVAGLNLWCVLCAKQRWGEKVIQAVTDNVPGWEQYKDNNGDLFGVVVEGNSDLHGMHCGDCHRRLCGESCSCYDGVPEGEYCSFASYYAIFRCVYGKTYEEQVARAY